MDAAGTVSCKTLGCQLEPHHPSEQTYVVTQDSDRALQSIHIVLNLLHLTR